MSPRAKLSSLLTALVLSVASAAAGESTAPAGSAAPVPSAGEPAAAGTASGRITSASRPIFIGLLAAVFLLVGGLAGANDRLRGDRPRSKRPPAP